MAITNPQREVDLSTGTKYLNLPVTTGMTPNGYWIYYEPANANNTALGATITPYRWDTPLPLANNQSNIIIEGTIALITESWDGANVKYHGASLEWIGSGINDITGEEETDAFFFGHMGATTASDDKFYWDRMYQSTSGSDWDYYQYHAHSPTTYVTYENGRITMSAGGYIDPGDKAYGYEISTNARVQNVNYTSVLARVHTPSVGGAHNSHNDITLPTVANKNYLQSGIIRGAGERFHAWYITANSTQWDVFNRTYTDASTSFTAQVQIGTYDLADPSFNPSTGVQSQYPIRASAGTTFGARIYFPVIMANTTTSSNFDLEVWSFNSLDTIAGGSLTRTTLTANVTVRPDCYLCLYGSTELYAAYTDTTSGGVRIKKTSDGTTYTDVGQFLTNGVNDPIRVHGFEFNTADFKFYALLSGTASGGANTYLGAGLYSFQTDDAFTGYKHLDYSASDNSFVLREPLANGYVQLNTLEYSWEKSTNQEPQAIASGTNIFDYGQGISSSWYNPKQIGFGGKDFYYHAITLKDGRRLAVGQVAENPDNLGSGTTADFLFSVYNSDLGTSQHYAFGGPGDDYWTGVYQSNSDPSKVWLTGYTKSELVPKGDIYIHGWARNLTDGSNEIEYKDLAVDSSGNVYCLGKHITGLMLVTKYDSNYDLIWQYALSDTAPIGNGIAVDSAGNVYVCGSTTDAGAGSTDAMLIKITPAGAISFAKAYGTASAESATSIAIITKGSTEYVVLSVVTGTTTTFLITDLSGTIVEQSKYIDLIVNRVRVIQSQTTQGRFAYVGNDGAGTTKAKFGVGEITSSSGKMIQWENLYGGAQSYAGYDIVNTDAAVSGLNAGFVICGTKGTLDAFLLKVEVDEVGGSYTVTKNWAKTMVVSDGTMVETTRGLFGLCATPHTEATRYVYAVGCTNISGVAAMGMEEGLTTRWDASDGTLDWQNVFGHDMIETFLAIANDTTGLNTIAVGWSESHVDSRAGVLFRSENIGFGTGLYTFTGTNTAPYYYQKTTLTHSTNTDTLTSSIAPANDPTNFATATYTGYTWSASPYSSGNYDGAYGVNGVFQFVMAYIDLNLLQEYQNSEEFISQNGNDCNNHLVYISDWSLIGDLWQAATVGDSSADDGNMFGYDIIEASSGQIFAIGQTSGDVAKTNAGSSGVYDYLLVRFDPAIEEFEWYQNGTAQDEETYALCELENGKIAFVGRTTGNLGAANSGGYDIFLGIYDPTTDVFDYYSKGSGLDDRAVNVHDLGNDELIITYSSFGTLGDDPNAGSEDLGAIKFNYDTDEWGTNYQFGSTTSEFFEQNGKPSALLSNNRLAITVSSTGIFADDAVTYGFLDLCLAILDIETGTWKAYQYGTAANEISSSLSSNGEQLLIAGNQGGSFTDDIDAIFVEFDAADHFIGKAASI